MHLLRANAQTSHRRQHPEAGFMMLAVVVMVAIVLIGLAVAAPIIAKDLRRDKEVESKHRAQQYVRALQLYMRACKCTAYPASMDALEKSTTVRFLRKRYVDPLTGKSDWRLIHSPQTKSRGFFGEELSGLTAGLGSAAGMASSGTAGTAGTAGTSSSTISAGGLAGGFNGATIGGTAGTSGATGSSGSSGSTGGTSAFGDGTGGVIYGVGTSRTGESILTPNQQTTYETWEFWYDPKIELLKANVNILGGGGPPGTASSGNTGGSSTSASDFGTNINGVSNAPGRASGATGSTGPTSGTPVQPGVGGAAPQ